MKQHEIEKLIFDSAADPLVNRGEVRGWVTAERRRSDKSFVIRSCVLAGLFLGLSFLLYRAIDAEMNQVKQMVHVPRPAALVTLEEVVDELCGEPPAEYWVEQLGRTKFTSIGRP